MVTCHEIVDFIVVKAFFIFSNPPLILKSSKSAQNGTLTLNFTVINFDYFV